MKNIRESILIVGKIRYGKVNKLKRHIGDSNFEYLLKNGFIYQGKSYPEIWRITEKGIKRSNSLKNKIGKFLALILWKLGWLS